MAIILLIDDDVDLVEMNRMVLASRGHEVKTAFSASQGRELLNSVRPDVVVADVMMESDTAGFELAREIHERFPEMPTIMLSSLHAATGVPFRFKPDETWLPIVKFLDKPVSPAELADEVDAVLRQRSEKK